MSSKVEVLVEVVAEVGATAAATDFLENQCQFIVALLPVQTWQPTPWREIILVSVQSGVTGEHQNVIHSFSHGTLTGLMPEPV